MIRDPPRSAHSRAAATLCAVTRTPAYDQLRIVEIAGGWAGAFAAKQFADHGARVVRVEPPGGSADRGEGERLPRHAFGDGEIGASWAYCNTSKSIAELEPGSPGFDRLLDHADIVIESSAPGPLRPLTADRSDQRLIKVYISPLGLGGPLAEWRSNVFTDDALGGHMYLNGEPDREPIRRLGRHTEYSGGMYGYIGAISALLARERAGRGQTVEIAHMECMVAMHQHTTTMWTHGGHILKREGNAQPGIWHPAGVYECKDGYVFLCHSGSAKLVPFLEAAGLGHILEDPRFATDVDRGARKKEFNEAIRPWLMSKTVEELCELGEATFSPMGPVWDTGQYLADPHLRAREFLVPLDPDRGDEKIPRGSFRIGAEAGNPRPPRPLDSAGLDAFCAEPPHDPEGAGERLPDGPLTGIRVLDLTRVWAGPIAGRLLADLGADVIHIESPWNRGPKEAPPGIAELTHLYPDNLAGERHWNRVGGFNKLARNKRSLVLDLASERGQALFRGLIAETDVILENFSPRVFPQWNLDAGALAALNPAIVHAAMPGYGAFGPGANRVALGPVIEAATGMTAMMGYPDTGPYRSGVAWPDPVSGMSAVAAVLTALWRRAAGGGAQHVECPMIESMGTFVGDVLLTAELRGGPPPRRGNRQPGLAPQGVYRCAGDDRWVAISITGDDEWRALCETLALPADWHRWTAAEREARHDEIDRAIGRWTRSNTPWGAARKLQAAGVIAAPVADARDLWENEHLQARDFWAWYDSESVGPMPYPGCPVRLSRTPVSYRIPPPQFGEHNRQILADLLHLTEPEIADLEAAEIIRDEPLSIRNRI